jgi:hypothetical protein
MKPEQEFTIDDIMTYWSRGKSMQETADHFGKTYRVIEQMVARYGYRYERAFNFPHIIHAKRFGA